MSSRNILRAIQKINPNAMVTIYGSDIDTCTFTWHEGITPISKADIKAKMAEIPTDEEEATAKENLKASAKAKLIAGEALTEDEANVMIGG